MKRLKRSLAITLIINIIFGLISGFSRTAVAAPSIHLVSAGYEAGTLNITWDVLPSRGDTVITYHSPDSENPQKLETIIIPANAPNPGKGSIIKLKNDYIYDIKVQVKDISNNSILGEDTMFFLPGISFYSAIVDQQPVEIAGGGSESGSMPALKVSWAVPKVYDGTGFVHINNVPDLIDARLKQTNFTISILDRIQRSDVTVSYNSSTGTYSASASGDDIRTADVKYDGTSGMLYFYLLGRKDDTAYLPTISEVLNNKYSDSSDSTQNGKEVLPISIAGDRNYVLPHMDILPGTVYVMNINALPVGNNGSYLDVIASGVNGSPLIGSFPYIYTPIRFGLTKDSTDYLYIKIYKVNKGSLDLPRLYYEVQTNSIPSSQNNTWTVKKTLDDTYFNGEYAYSVISGINPNNTVYYRIVVKTDGTDDKVESLKMPYILKDDTSRPPVPRGVMVVRKELAANPGYEEKSTNITIAWDKPANWDQIKTKPGGTYDPGKDIYFHILLNIAPTDMNIQPTPVLEAEGKQYGTYPVSYRLVKYVSANSPNIVDSGTKLQYTVKGFELFSWEDNKGVYHDIANPENYPDFLLPNKVYYVQMYTSNSTDKGSIDPAKISDKSLTVSFTTLSGAERDVPLPDNFELDKNYMNDNGENTIEMQFDKVSFDWTNYTSNHSPEDAVYYDLYMSTRPQADSFVRIGTTENTDGDVVFEGAEEIQSTFIKARISTFRQGVNAYDPDNNPATDNSRDPYEVFGSKLLPNTTYYFIVKTRLVIINPPNPPNPEIIKVSPASEVVPVTTVRGGISGPDESFRKPLAPIDFTIARDANGNPLLTGQTVSFNWLKKENNVTYRLICTSSRVEPDAEPSTYSYDPLYQSFNQKFAGSRNSELVLNPSAVPLANNFAYDSKGKMFKYTINTWLFPNRLYYFSLRAETVSDGGIKASSWVSIPVTTTLIEGPSMLEPVNDSQLAFSWIDNNPGMKAEDYKIYIKGSNDSDYTLVTRSNSSIIRDVKNGNISFYGRLYSLKPDTLYSVKVEKAVFSSGATTYIKVYENTAMRTKDDFSQLEVKWRGLPADEYSYYEIAIKTDEDKDYTVLTGTDLEHYADASSGHDYPYYIEKTSQTAGTNYNMFHATIKSMLVKLPDGTMEHRPLRSNMRYYIKVRAVKADPEDLTLITYSKFIGPVDTRTEFNQDEYDDNDQDSNNKAVFLDRIEKLEGNLYWRMAISNSAYNKILLKGDRVVNAIENNTGQSFVLDISGIVSGTEVDVVYVPGNVAEALNTANKILVIRTAEAEYIFRPKTLSLGDINEIASIKATYGVKDVFLKMTISRGDYPASSLPGGVRQASRIHDLEVQAVGSTKTDGTLKEMIHDKLYNNETGLIKRKIDILTNPYDNSGVMTPQQINRYMEMLVESITLELSEYIEDIVEGGPGTSSMIRTWDYIKTFSAPMQVKIISADDQGLKVPYVWYDGKTSWQKVTQDVSYSGSTISFNSEGTGRFGIFSASAPAGGIPDGYWAKESIVKLTSKYDLSDVFVGSSQYFNPEYKVSVKELILLYEKVIGSDGENSGLDIKNRAKKLGLDSIVNVGNAVRNISREESAAVLVKLYCTKLGVKADSLIAGSSKFIKDEQAIDSKYYRYAVLALDLGFLSLDQNSRFNPASPVTRAEMVEVFVKLLELTGDI